MSDFEVPASLDLLDVAGNGVDCERFLWIRGLSDPQLEPRSRVDLLDDLQRFPGELLHLASRDGTAAATMFTIRDEHGAGSCYLSIFSRSEPGEPIVGDLVALASQRARAGGVSQVRCGLTDDLPLAAALQERHGFIVHERWRRFHVHPETAPPQARLDAEGMLAGVHAATLASKPELADAAFEVYRHGMADTPGDFPRTDETLERWLHERDSSPILGRDLVLLLLDDADEVLAVVELERLAMGSRSAWVEFLTVARAHRRRGLATLAKRCAVEHARVLGLTRLQTMNHADNVAICTLNEQLGWTEDVVRVALRLDV